MGTTPKSIGTAEFALWLNASRGGGSTYVSYLVLPGQIATVIDEIAAELRALDETLAIDIQNPSPSAEHLVRALASITKELVLIGVESYREEDWRLLDRRRSSLAREGVTVFFTTSAGFASLMRVAPNLASWLGGLVFEREDDEAQAREQRERRLIALRKWAGKTDQEIIQSAEAGSLPRDPEYAEWLVLLGREICWMPDVTSFSALQRYTTERPLELPMSAVDLWRRLRATLIQASNARKIKTPPREIERSLLLLKEPPPQVLKQLRERDLHKSAACIVLGEKNQNRDDSLRHIRRNDGAWFDFSIIVRQLDDHLELLAYDFEIRLVPGMGAPFLRFDLNLPDHRNQDRELRCHLHPGCDDVLVPAPLMSPSEVLALFIDGARLPAGRSPRAPTAFDVRWLKQTLDRISGTDVNQPS